MKKIISVLLIVLMLSACASQPKELSSVEVANKFLDGLETFNVEEMNKYLDVKVNQDQKDMVEIESFKPLLKKLIGNGFSAKSETISGDKKTSEVQVVAEIADLKEIMQKFVAAAFSAAFEEGFSDKSEEEQQKIILKKLDEMTTDVKTVQQNLTLYMIKIGDEWKVEDLSGKNEEFLAPFFKDLEGVFPQE